MLRKGGNDPGFALLNRSPNYVVLVVPALSQVIPTIKVQY
jgi:hypothetical protein